MAQGGGGGRVTDGKIGGREVMCSLWGLQVAGRRGWLGLRSAQRRPVADRGGCGEM